MKNARVLLILSLIANIVLGYFLFKANKEAIDPENYRYISMQPQLIDLSNDKVFKEIFVNRNDSVYRRYFGNTFESDPVRSFLLACTYYMMGDRDKSIHDIKVISMELKGRYGYSPKLILKNK